MERMEPNEQSTPSGRETIPAPDANGQAANPPPPPELARVTRQLPANDDRKQLNQATNAATRERIVTLIGALGEPNHPLHQRAGEDLIAIGQPAVQQLCDALAPQHPWLIAYRAAEALGRIGDGRAAGPLLEALRHQNSNVRWSAVRALASVGDARALIELRRVARNDQGRTSWGESVSGAAQSVLDQMQDRNVLLRGADLIKTAIACVCMLVGLILAWSFGTALREEIRTIGLAEARAAELGPLVRTAEPTIPIPTPELLPTSIPIDTTEQLTPVATVITGNEVVADVLVSGNVRAQPSRSANNVIGSVTEGDQVFVLAATSDRNWFRIILSDVRSASSRINSDDGTGWVARSLLSPIDADVPTEDPPIPTRIPASPEPPTPEPEPPTLTPIP